MTNHQDVPHCQKCNAPMIDRTGSKGTACDWVCVICDPELLGIKTKSPEQADELSDAKKVALKITEKLRGIKPDPECEKRLKQQTQSKPGDGSVLIDNATTATSERKADE